MSWTWWAYNHSEPLFMRALQANFTILGICMCSTELLPWKNQKRSTRYPMTLQKRDSIADFFPLVDLGREYRGHVTPPPIFSGIAHKKHTKTNNINKFYQICSHWEVFLENTANAELQKRQIAYNLKTLEKYGWGNFKKL